ncbi:glycosyl transferase [Shewanella colwelliana]|uniref:glycosyltransferase n=1 Tax=Shewanella colwelliana TaxID=23 RepID=UPI001BC071BD|nr:glycosyltransferase [Shewanella colwelliana]GIU29223.1 glycosyl transferase [Shewanella colwelliana]
MKRIAIAIDSLAGGGAEKIVLTLAAELKRLGHAPHLLVLTPHCEYQLPADIPVHFCFDESQKHSDSIWRVSRSVEEVKRWVSEIEAEYGLFNLFLSNLDKTNLLFTQANLSPLFCIVHNSIEEELKRQLKLGPLAYFNMLRAKKSLNGQHLVTVSKGIEREIIACQRISPQSIRTIYNPFDLKDIRGRADELNQAIPNGDFIIHVGRVAKQKRHDILFAALAKMKHQLPLVLLCSNPKKAMKLAKKYGVADRIICPGFQANPFPWIKKARLLALSSDFEGFGNVLMEALICGTPVVSTDCPHGPNEILTGPLADFLSPRRDVDQLSEKMDAALCDYPNMEDIALFEHIEIEKIAKTYLALI